MKFLVLLALFAVALAQTTVPGCHPVCSWNCDNPQCPAVCHPICERPKCEMKCNELANAKCTTQCGVPQCEVRCPKDMCEGQTCPKCEIVCRPAECRSVCIPPDPVCTPMCEEAKCEWKCSRPVTCPRPKCELVCQASACQETPPTCCACTNNQAAQLAVAAANTAPVPKTATTPSFLEVMDEARFGNENTQCCPCK